MQEIGIQYSVPTLSIVFMAITAMFGIVIPVVLFLIFRKKYKTDIAPFFIGCAVFFVFAIILEGIINTLIFTSGVGKTIQGNIWLYGIIGGFMAGLFEETGRFTAFKTVFKKYRANDKNSLMYGAGHGGFEAFFILFFSMLSNIIISLMLNAGMTNMLTAGVTDEAMLQNLSNVYQTLSQTPSITFLIGTIERIGAVALHISLSVLVWFAAKKGGMCFWFYPLSILLHCLVNAVAVIMSKYVASLWLVEVMIYIMSACCALIALKVWKKYSSSYEEFEETGAGEVETGEIETGEAGEIESGEAGEIETGEAGEIETGEAGVEMVATGEIEVAETGTGEVENAGIEAGEEVEEI